MGWSLLHTETLTVVRVTMTGVIDADGIAVTTETSTPWPGCHVQQAATSEDTVRAERVMDALDVSGDLVTWLGEGDKVMRGGVAYRVEGKPAHFTNVIPHTEAVLVRWTGA